MSPALEHEQGTHQAKSDNDNDNDNVDIRVQSSLPDTDEPDEDLSSHPAARSTHSNIDTDSDADDDAPDVSTVRTVRTPAGGVTEEFTPATSGPTNPFQTTGTIEETPARSTKAGVVPFELHRLASSQAQTCNLGDITSSAVVQDPDSPLAKKGDTQASASALVHEIEESGKSQNVLMDSHTPRKFQNTYGKHRQKAHAVRAKHTAKSSFKRAMQGVPDFESGSGSVSGDSQEDNITAAVSILNEDAIDEAEGVEADPGQNEARQVEPASDLLRTSQAADEAAGRSMHPRGTKRKLSAATTDNDDDHITAVPKRSKRNAAGTGLPEALDSAEEKSSAEKPRPRRRTRVAIGRREDSSTDDETIVVAETRSKPKAPSPQVKLSRRSKTPASSATPSTLTGRIPKVLLSHSEVNRPRMLKFLRSQDVHIADDVLTRGSNFICVTSGTDLSTTAKLLRSIALGKDVVTDEWVRQSLAAGELLATSEFLHPAVTPSKTVDRSRLFEGKTLHFTHALSQAYGDGWDSVEALAKEAGAKGVVRAVKRAVDQISRDDMIYLGNEQNDPDTTTLMETEGRVVYNRHLLSQSVLSGMLLIDNKQFMINKPDSKGKAKSKQGRKSR